MMNYFSITPPPNLIAPNDRIALPPRSSPVEPPHMYRLRRVRVFLVGCCVWLSSHSKDVFFRFFISFRRPEQRDIPTPHASTTPPSTRHRRERRRRRRRAPAGAGKSPNRPPPRPPPRPNPRPLRFGLVGGHRGVSARRLERGAPRPDEA